VHLLRTLLHKISALWAQRLTARYVASGQPQSSSMGHDRTRNMHEELWAGVELTIDNARFQFEGMNRALELPEPTAYNAALESSGAIVGGNWYRPFYAHLDAFLSAARSIPDIVQSCFGINDGNRKMKDWLAAMDQDERDRREKFRMQFQADYDAFRGLPLGTARHISEHRTGFPPVVAIPDSVR
jgi:hypothetical protein